MTGSESTSRSTPRPATQDYVEDYSQLSHCINYCSKSTDYAKYYYQFSYGIKYDSRFSDFLFSHFPFVLLVWTDGLGPTTVPHSDCDGAPLRGRANATCHLCSRKRGGASAFMAVHAQWISRDVNGSHCIHYDHSKSFHLC